MEIQHTFEVYQKQLAGLRKNNHYGRPQVLNQFRMQFKGFGDNDISVLKSFLADNDKKWFVASLLEHLDTFPRDLLIPTLTAAVNEPDPSFNDEFIKPCRRVFGYVDIQNILLDIFRKGDKDKKIGVLKALYWASPTVYPLTILDGDNTFLQKGYEVFVWNDQLKEYNYSLNFVEDERVFEREYPGQLAVYTEQVKTILAEFHNSRDLEVKYHIALRLPDKAEEFPFELQSAGKAYLLEIEKQGIPRNIPELKRAKKMNSSFFRRFFFKTKRLFMKEKGITLKQR